MTEDGLIGLVDFHFLLSILCVLLILSRLTRATISVFFVRCRPVLLSVLFGFILLTYLMFELNKWRNGDLVSEVVRLWLVSSVFYVGRN